jgi:hypothetical protein
MRSTSQRARIGHAGTCPCDAVSRCRSRKDAFGSKKHIHSSEWGCERGPSFTNSKPKRFWESRWAKRRKAASSWRQNQNALAGSQGVIDSSAWIEHFARRRASVRRRGKGIFRVNVVSAVVAVFFSRRHRDLGLTKFSGVWHALPISGGIRRAAQRGFRDRDCERFDDRSSFGDKTSNTLHRSSTKAGFAA